MEDERYLFRPDCVRMEGYSYAHSAPEPVRIGVLDASSEDRAGPGVAGADYCRFRRGRGWCIVFLETPPTVIFFAVLACLLIPSLAAQSPKQTPAQDVPIATTTTRLVEVNVIARDNKGPVAGLMVDDFILFDQGKRREIKSFSMVRSRAKSGSGAAAPEASSNALERGEDRPGNVTVILLDALNTPQRFQTFARRQVIGWLKQVEPGEEIAIYVLGRSLGILHDFTSDAKSLAELLSVFRGEHVALLEASQPEPSNTGVPAVDSIIDQLNAVLANDAITGRAEKTLAAVGIIAERLSPIPGRKSLVWISSGFPFSIGLHEPSLFSNPSNDNWAARRNFEKQVERVARAVNHANIAIYPVDASGLGVGASFQSADRGIGQGRPRQGSREEDAVLNARATMEELAARTGGRAFYNSNDLKRAIETAIRDSELTYTLGFYPDAADMDGKFHELKVQTKRKGVRLRHRKGYLALGEGTSSN
ncbi:MAG TPA: VWA domain-containing protein [Bryobacteraceae bacterium]|nr:VWA domain-containing protein [Bryobacteraceae bacterium]